MWVDQEKAAAGQSEIPGMPGLPAEVVARAHSDPLFLHHLLVVRDCPELLARLVAEASESNRSVASPPVAPAVISHAVHSLLRWAISGFGVTTREILEQRLAACRFCLHCIDRPSDLVYSATVSVGAKICAICGCPVERKAHMPTERCPDTPPRWTA